MGENTERQKQRDRERGKTEEMDREGEREKEEREGRGTKRRPMLESALALRVTERTGCFYGDSLESLGKVTLKL